MLVCVVMSCLFFLALWSPAGIGLTTLLSHVLCFVTFPNLSWSTSESRVRLVRETGLSPHAKYFTDRSKAVLLLWIFYVYSVLYLLSLCASVYMCLGKG